MNYYKNILKQKGELVYEEPAIHQFDTGKYKEETMAFPPSVTVKDYTWGGSAGYLNPKRGKQPARFKTIIQIVPHSADTRQLLLRRRCARAFRNTATSVFSGNACAIRFATSVASGMFLSRTCMSQRAKPASARTNESPSTVAGLTESGEQAPLFVAAAEEPAGAPGHPGVDDVVNPAARHLGPHVTGILLQHLVERAARFPVLVPARLAGPSVPSWSQT